MKTLKNAATIYQTQINFTKVKTLFKKVPKLQLVHYSILFQCRTSKMQFLNRYIISQNSNPHFTRKKTTLTYLRKLGFQDSLSLDIAETF